VARVLGQQAGRSRTFTAAMSAARTTARSFGRVLHQLWLEVTGVVFLIMALSFAGATFKEYGKYHAGQVGIGRLAAAFCFTVTFAWFGLSSFWRVRRKSQSQ
jgi:type VI protein secretion system component VasK